MTQIRGTTRWAGVMGWPVTHSKSPLIHNYWCVKYGVDAVYLPLPVSPESLSVVIPALAKMGCAGVNLTIPHKELVLPLAGQLDSFAKKIGAVNTLVIKDGALLGYNTDAYGFWQNLESSVNGIKRGAAFVVGAGGAARAVVAALDDAGFAPIYIMNRTREKAAALRSISPQVRAVDWSNRPSELKDCCLLVNTTSLGMQGQPPLELALDALPADALVTDIVYTPLQTPLLQAAGAQGLRVVDGLGMLLYQAQKAFELWFGILPDVTEKLRAIVLGERI